MSTTFRFINVNDRCCPSWQVTIPLVASFKRIFNSAVIQISAKSNMRWRFQYFWSRFHLYFLHSLFTKRMGPFFLYIVKLTEENITNENRNADMRSNQSEVNTRHTHSVYTSMVGQIKVIRPHTTLIWYLHIMAANKIGTLTPYAIFTDGCIQINYMLLNRSQMCAAACQNSC